MLTFQQKWQNLHHPSTDVSGDADFYCRLYEKLCRLTRQEARQSDAAILSLLLYTENIIATGLDGVYEYMYRSLGDVVFRWCDGLGMDANATSQVHNLVSEAVAEAPRSTLRRWITGGSRPVRNGPGLQLARQARKHFAGHPCRTVPPLGRTCGRRRKIRPAGNGRML